MRRWKRNDEWCVMDCVRHYQFKLIFIRVEWFPHHRTFKRNRLRHERENSPISPRSLLFPKSNKIVYISYHRETNGWGRKERRRERVLLVFWLSHVWFIADTLYSVRYSNEYVLCSSIGVELVNLRFPEGSPPQKWDSTRDLNPFQVSILSMNDGLDDNKFFDNENGNHSMQ